MLQNFGLVYALETFITPIKANEKIKIKLTFDNIQRFDIRNEITIYRTITELINNTLKHASANNIDISMFSEDNILKLHYKDNGKGFDTKQQNIKGMGIANMHNRITALNGKINYISAPNEGMQAFIEIPYYLNP